MTSPFIEPVLLSATLLLAALILVFVAYKDIKSRLIPNLAILALAFLFIPLSYTISVRIDLHLLIFVVVFLFTFFCFHRKWLGGGDAKLIPVIALWVGPDGILPFLLLMTFGGAIVAMIMMALHAKKADGWKSLKLPYGVAIAASALACIGSAYAPDLITLWEAAT